MYIYLYICSLYAYVPNLSAALRLAGRPLIEVSGCYNIKHRLLFCNIRQQIEPATKGGHQIYIKHEFIWEFEQKIRLNWNLIKIRESQREAVLKIRAYFIIPILILVSFGLLWPVMSINQSNPIYGILATNREISVVKMSY